MMLYSLLALMLFINKRIKLYKKMAKKRYNSQKFVLRTCIYYDKKSHKIKHSPDSADFVISRIITTPASQTGMNNIDLLIKHNHQ